MALLFRFIKKMSLMNEENTEAGRFLNILLSIKSLICSKNHQVRNKLCLFVCFSFVCLTLCAASILL